MKTVGVLLARGGSKGVPRKHLRLLGDKPMLAYSLEAVKGSKLLDEVVFSTDCEEMAAMAKDAGVATPFLRPAELASDTAATADVVEHAVAFLEAQGKVFDTVVTLQATSPFRTAAHIDKALQTYEKSGADSLLTIKTQDYPPWWLFKKDGMLVKQAFPWDDGKTNVFRVGRQFFPQTYRPNGAVYVVKREFLKNQRMCMNPQSLAYLEMDSLESCSVDTELDFLQLEAVLKYRATQS